MGDNPFKEDESISVFKDTPPTKKEQSALLPSSEEIEQIEDDAYQKFPKWDLLPPFKLIKRGGQK